MAMAVAKPRLDGSTGEVACRVMSGNMLGAAGRGLATGAPSEGRRERFALTGVKC
jgi:hypothetical protein